MAAEAVEPWAKEALLDLADDFKRAAEELRASTDERRNS
jgi:hypothetical protein